MSVTFYVARDPAGVPVHSRIDLGRDLNMANSNALDLMDWLGLPAEWLGVVPARDLAALCRRRLWDEPRNHDPALAEEQRANWITLARLPDYLRGRTERLLKIAETAGDLWVAWS